MRVPLGLIRGNGIGLLTTSAHARLFPAQQPAEKKGREVHNYQAHVTRTSDTFSLQRLCSSEQKGHFLVWNSAFKDCDVKRILICIQEEEKEEIKKLGQPELLIIHYTSVASGSDLLSGLRFVSQFCVFAVSVSVLVLAGLLCPPSSPHLVNPSSSI